jgi:hypothetical protein
MECLLCAMWGRMPYAKKHTTPTTAQETEGALVVGYWTARNQVLPNQVPPICQRHMTVLGILDGQEERRVQIEQASQRATQPPNQHYSAEVQRLQERQSQLVAGGLPAPAPAQQVAGPSFPLTPPIMAMAAAGISIPPEVLAQAHQPAVQPEPTFALGPGPLTNGNTVTGQPQLPVPVNQAEPYLTGVSAPPASQVTTVPNQPLMASDVRHDPALIDAPCLFCKKMVMAGEVHVCPQASSK